jgi:hypothetical protein
VGCAFALIGPAISPTASNPRNLLFIFPTPLDASHRAELGPVTSTGYA